MGHCQSPTCSSSTDTPVLSSCPTDCLRPLPSTLSGSQAAKNGTASDLQVTLSLHFHFLLRNWEPRTVRADWVAWSLSHHLLPSSQMEGKGRAKAHSYFYAYCKGGLHSPHTPVVAPRNLPTGPSQKRSVKNPRAVCGQ